MERCRASVPRCGTGRTGSRCPDDIRRLFPLPEGQGAGEGRLRIAAPRVCPLFSPSPPALGNGERIWLLAKLPDPLRIVGDDVADKYLLLANSHDGKGSVQVKFTSVRVVCQNTLTLAMHGGETFRIVHTQDVKHRLKEAGKLLANIRSRYATMEEALQTMAKVQMDESRLTGYLAEVFQPSDPTDEAASIRAERSRNWSGYFFDQGRGNRLPGVTGTFWAAFNGVSEWLDHRKTRQNPGQRLNSLWFGDNYRVKARAFALAQEKMEAWKN